MVKAFYVKACISPYAVKTDISLLLYSPSKVFSKRLVPAQNSYICVYIFMCLCRHTRIYIYMFTFTENTYIFSLDFCTAKVTLETYLFQYITSR